MADYNEAIRLDPDSAAAYVLRASAYMTSKDFAHAIADFGEAIRLAPKTADLYMLRGTAYYAMKDYGRAIAELDRAIALNPDGDARYYTYRAAAYSVQGDEERAKADRLKAKQARHGQPGRSGGMFDLLRPQFDGFRQ